MLLSCWGGGVDEVWDGGVVAVGCCLEVVGVSEVVGVVLGLGAELEGCETPPPCDEVGVVEDLDSTGNDATIDEGVF